MKRPAAARPRAVRQSKAFLARAGFRACPGIPPPVPRAGWPAGVGSVNCWTRCGTSLVSPGARPATQETSWPAGVRIISARRARTASMICRAAGSASIDSSGRLAPLDRRGGLRGRERAPLRPERTTGRRLTGSR